MSEYDFRAMLSKTHSAEDRKWWEAVLPCAVPNFEKIRWNDTKHRQRQGRDILLIHPPFESECELKLREPFYNDILIEVFHTPGPELGDVRKPGWIDLLTCDLIAYGWRETNRAVVMSFPKLRQQWRLRDWKDRKPRRNNFPSRGAYGGGWWTWNVSVHLKQIRRHVGAWEGGIDQITQRGSLFESAERD